MFVEKHFMYLVRKIRYRILEVLSRHWLVTTLTLTEYGLILLLIRNNNSKDDWHPTIKTVSIFIMINFLVLNAFFWCIIINVEIFAVPNNFYFLFQNDPGENSTLAELIDLLIVLQKHFSCHDEIITDIIMMWKSWSELKVDSKLF